MRDPVFPDQDHELTELVRKAQCGAPGAHEALLARVRPRLVRFFAQWIPGDDAEDAVQRALLEILRALSRIDPSHATQYIVRLARNLAWRECRRLDVASRRAAPVELADLLESPLTADGAAEWDDVVRAVDRASRIHLVPTQRAVILGLLEGRTIAEIAAEHGVNPTSIRTRLTRIRPHLRALRG